MIDGALNPVHQLFDLRIECSIAGAFQAFCVDYARHRGHGGVDLVIDDYVWVQIYRLQLVFDTLKSTNQRFGVLRAASLEAFHQHLCRWRENEDENRIGERARELPCALDVDVHDDVPRGRQHALHLRPQCSVQMAVNLCRLGKLPCGLAALEFLEREEMVVPAVHLSRPRRPRRARDRVADIGSHRQQPMSYGSLPSAGRRRQDDRERHYSRFSTCSRIRSSSSLIAITSSWIWASLALLPMVFASRTMSWRMNPSRFPTGSAVLDCAVSRNAARCDRNRSNSSATSSLSARIAISWAIR